MTFQLPPANEPKRSPNEKFYAFLARNVGQHGMPVLPSAFEELEFYWMWHEPLPGHTQPFTLTMDEVAQTALENPIARNAPSQLALRAAALSQGQRAVMCYDDPDALSVGDDDGTWLQKVSLKELVFQCATNGLGAVFLSQRRMFQLSAGTVFKLTGLEAPTEQILDVGLPDDPEFGPSGISQERQDLFREMIARNDDWIVPGTIEFVTCTAGDGDRYEGITFQVKPGTPESKVAYESKMLGDVVTIITNEPFAVMPQTFPETPFTHDR